jgi:DNA primase
MAFPPGFLDELRARVPLGSLVGRRVKLIRRGRELGGLCPFHHEKTPSFYVVEDKGFFHCFGCGAHGDAIGYLMRAENLDFIEAIERLAAEAGLAVPQQTPQDRERAQRQKTSLEALAAAAKFYEARLWSPAGTRAREYLAARGLDEETIRRFGLGWASDDRQALRRALSGEFPEALLIEGGLLRRPESGGEPYDYFRGRVLFPIGDRAGRVIAFGGRTMGDEQPKYLNSPDTPLFEKGRVLYAWAAARGNLARAETGEAPAVIVVEGYMDVIALHRAGFGTAVAPLGTALTEAHLQELWRLSPEPVLCLDGDTAGQRAMLRALHRALPLLQPGRSLRFAVLPAGEDPDSLVRSGGKPAFAEILAAARPLSEVLWHSEFAARPIDTPERRADFERRLMGDAALIADRAVQSEYRRFFRERLFTLGRAAGGRPAGGRAPWSKGRPASPQGAARAAIPGILSAGEVPPPPPRSPARLRREILLRMLLQHPFLAGEASEEIAALDFPEPELDRLRREILQVEVLNPGLDASGLRQHLERCGFGSTLDGLLSPSFDHAGFLAREGDEDAVRQGWLHVLRMIREEVRSERATAAEALARDPSDATWDRFVALHGRQTEEDVATAEFLSGGASEQDPR